MNLQTDLTCTVCTAQNTEGFPRTTLLIQKNALGVGTGTAEGVNTLYFRTTLDDGWPLDAIGSESCMLRIEPRTINDDGLD